MKAGTADIPRPTRLTPALTLEDDHAAYWVARAILTLRREVCWCWLVREAGREHSAQSLPPVVDAAAENLDLVRYEGEKVRFFDSDPAARYLTEQLLALRVPPAKVSVRGSWAWLAGQFNLDEASQFLLGLALAARIDAATGPILATCLNDRSRPFATLAVAQRLWPDPLAIVGCADAAHPLFSSGLLFCGEPGGDLGWLSPLEMHAPVARQLANPSAPLPRGLRELTPRRPLCIPESARFLSEHLRANPPEAMQIVPIIGSPDTDFENWTSNVAALAGRQIVTVGTAAANDTSLLAGLAVVAWLRDKDLLLPEGWVERPGDKTAAELRAALGSLQIRLYVPAAGRELFAAFPNRSVTSPFEIPLLSFADRVERFREGFDEVTPHLAAAIDECSRRFRFGERAIDRIVRTFRETGRSPGPDGLILACRGETASTMGMLAQLVTPRFDCSELVLPARQQQQFDEILHAMRSLTEVHYHWGTARVWNESGLTVLFSGLPGTGKTMAAEALSTSLSLPMYRVDLSQVVNKYVGETEKNLKRIFDSAELNDCILFFDEADAIFGRRTEVKDAHDRFANIEISYLLERMERFKGLAILATNRKKDLDEAFLRRLRFVVEFPLPGPQERERIWRQVFPPEVDVSDIDFGYLARQFSLAGGHIRSISFAACLQSAGVTGSPSQSQAIRKVNMKTALIAVKRELEKLNRAAGDGVFGSYEETMRGLAP